MSMVVPALIGLVIASGSFTFIYEKSNIDLKENIRTLQTTKSIDILNSGLYLMESELNKDIDWNDNSDINIDKNNLDKNGFYALNSTNMNKLIKNYSISDGLLNIYIKPTDSNNINVIAESMVNDNKSYIALKLSRLNSYNDYIPLMYGGKNATYKDTTLCTYVQDKTNYDLMGITNTNLSLYSVGSSSFNGISLKEGNTMTTGNNAINRDFKVFADTDMKPFNSFDINGDNVVYDKIYSTGSVGLYNGATANEVISNNRISTDYNSCLSKYDLSYCGKSSDYIRGNALSSEVSPNSYVRPEFKDTLTDNTLSKIDNKKILVCGNDNENVISKEVETYKKNDYEIINVSEISDSSYEYEYFIINTNCNFDLKEHNWKFNNLIISNNSDLTFTNPNSLIERKNITLSYNRKIVYENIADDDYVTIKSENINLGENSSSISCTRVEKCLIDTNNLTNNKKSGGYAQSSIQGTILARNNIFIGDASGNGFEFIGNVFSENIQSSNRIYCNVVGEDSKQLVANNSGDNFLSIISNDNGSSLKNINNVSKTIMKEICVSVDDCSSKLK